MGEDILEVLFSLGNGQSLDGFGGLVGILVMNSQVSSGAFCDYISAIVPLEVEGFLE